MNMKTACVIGFLALAAAGCGGADEETDSGPLWTQVFASWSCQAAGRPAWAWSARRLSEFGEAHEWKDGATGATEKASVWETSIYLEQGGKAFRNFEYKVVTSEVLDHLEEWTLTAGGAAPYVCTK